MAELADALVLGTSSSECRFDSCYPHHLKKQSKKLTENISKTVVLKEFHGFFILLKLGKKMEFLKENLWKDEKFEKRINFTCSFNNAKCEFKQGKILNIKGTNINLIEPHKVDVFIKNKKILLIYFDKDNLFLYNRTMPLTIKQLDFLLKYIKNNLL